MKKQFGIVAGLSLALLLTGCNNGKTVLEYKYEDNNVPGTKYEVALYDSKKLIVKETKHCNYEKCKDKTEKKKIELNEEEYNKVLQITENSEYKKELLSQALSSISEGEKEKASLKKDGTENWEKLYKEDDTNEDNILTFREYGNNLLDTIISEENKR